MLLCLGLIVFSYLKCRWVPRMVPRREPRMARAWPVGWNLGGSVVSAYGPSADVNFPVFTYLGRLG